jgi:probable F420-dependent oxidoreductase
VECWQNLASTPHARLVELARTAEDVGVTGVTLPEHLVTPVVVRTPNPYVAGGGTGYPPDTPFPDPLVTFAALGAVTTRLRFLADVLVLPLRNVFAVARSVATVAVLTGDRLVLGVGVGWLREEFDAVGASFTDRGARADEQLALLPRLLSGEPVGHTGRFHAFDPVRIVPAPAAPVPVLVGGASDAALARAARADGWVGVNHAVDDLAEILGRLAAARRVAGTAERPFRIVVSRPVECDRAVLHRMAALGVTAVVNRPTVVDVGPDAPAAAHRDVMAAFLDVVAGV